MGNTPLAQELTLPCGAVLSNCIAKAATTEGLSDEHLHATRGCTVAGPTAARGC